MLAILCKCKTVLKKLNLFFFNYGNKLEGHKKSTWKGSSGQVWDNLNDNSGSNVL